MIERGKGSIEIKKMNEDGRAIKKKRIGRRKISL
jgi:hypothetical protein